MACRKDNGMMAKIIVDIANRDILTEEGLEKFIRENREFYPSKTKIKTLYEDLKRIAQRYPTDEELQQVLREFRQLVNTTERLEVVVQQIYRLALSGSVPSDILVYFVDFVRNWTGTHIDLRQFRKKINN